MEASTLIDPRIVEAATTVVPVVTHGPLEHGTYETIVDGRTVARCRLYRNLECSEHGATEEALKPYQAAGRFRIPFTVWIGLDGRTLFRRDGWRRPEEFLHDIRVALEKIPGPSRSRDEYAALVKPLDEGFAALLAERYAEAAGKFEEARQPDVAEVRREAETGLREIRIRGDAILAAAKAALKAGRLRQARPALDLAAREFPALECGREAVEEIKKLPFPFRRLVLQGFHGSRGGRILFLRGDGLVVAQVVEVTKEGVLNERRYQHSLDARDLDELAKLVEIHGFFELKMPERAETGDEGRAAIEIEMWTGQAGRAAKRESDRHPGFDALYAWLLARVEAAARAKLAREGPYDPAWRPSGFAK